MKPSALNTNSQTMSYRKLRGQLLILFLILLVPTLPFLLFGHGIEQYFENWQQHPPSASVSAAVVFGLLASDILLPVPSSLVSTLGGSQLGWLWGTVVSFAGLNVGAVLGFWLARKFGPRLAQRFAAREDLAAMQKFSEKYGSILIVLTRALPILAEATVLLMGLNQLSWRRFLLPALLANLGIALGYSIFGEVAAEQEWLLIASAISVALPFGIAVVIRRLLHQRLQRADEIEKTESS
ncbi:MAG: DedA family protein [Blastopirellula sp.]|nr:MAG: DedA family protein [Blastopirellula sp.]